MTYNVFSLGCKVNSYEAASISALFRNRGYIEDKVNPDVMIINTCSVTHVADQKSRQHIRKFRKDYPHAVIAVMGCYAQGNYNYIINECGADIVVGTSNRNKLVDLVDAFLKTKEKQILVDPNPRTLCYEELGVTSCGENIRAYLKIQDGCNNFCTYCIVPYRRGVSRSRELEDIISEAKELIVKGYKELVISGIHIGMYGKDNGHSLEELLSELVKIPNMVRIRISSIEESEVSEELIKIVKENDCIAKHLHIPLQSGSNAILSKMGRRYTREQYINKMKYIQKEIPSIALTADIIVGFPSETDDDFLDTYNLVKEVGFKEIHVFPYSKRDGTVASKMNDQIDPKIKTIRSKKLLSLVPLLENDFLKKNSPSSFPVLIEQYKDGYNIGRSSNYIEVKFKDNKPRIGEYIDYKLVD